MVHTRFLLTPSTAQPYPLYIDSIGHHEDQEKLNRKDGLPHYHWLQTFSGEGEYEMGNRKVLLSKGSGVLMLPGEPHAYYAVTETWCTQYVTFGGNSVHTILSTLDMLESAVFRWDEEGPLNLALTTILNKLQTQADYSGYDASADLYHFLIQIKKHAQINNRTSITNQMLHLQPLTDWLEDHYPNPDTGIEQMAAVLAITPRHLNTLCQHAFGLSPYAYLIMMRLRKSKELLLTDRHRAIKEIAVRVGFRDTSHFIASFRKQIGLTPERFRALN
ncbi:helix-turn-helix domain-containing protein [Paenibacillus qinlingensis]|uniref:helix-turn-helix domain-containing protein n=1 Tax=Paenibacillus qinlingensis TaxID=1837343 RepID=UPI00156423F6|nr:AraC family transcriptional regulator [Paenibacillus qinlingensis]NQX60812.1 helix-turn-helix transcriptional regulator [Paenibacillus qinlingensis]